MGLTVVKILLFAPVACFMDLLLVGSVDKGYFMEYTCVSIGKRPEFNISWQSIERPWATWVCMLGAYSVVESAISEFRNGVMGFPSISFSRAQLSSDSQRIRTMDVRGGPAMVSVSGVYGISRLCSAIHVSISDSRSGVISVSWHIALYIR